jgi:hypothetical protein
MTCARIVSFRNSLFSAVLYPSVLPSLDSSIVLPGTISLFALTSIGTVRFPTLKLTAHELLDPEVQ